MRDKEINTYQYRFFKQIITSLIVVFFVISLFYIIRSKACTFGDYHDFVVNARLFTAANYVDGGGGPYWPGFDCAYDWGMDCSGLVFNTWRLSGHSYYPDMDVANIRTNDTYYSTVSVGDIRKGDIITVIYNGTPHCGIVTEVNGYNNVNIIHASGGANEVINISNRSIIGNSFWGSNYIIRRPKI